MAFGPPAPPFRASLAGTAAARSHIAGGAPQQSGRLPVEIAPAGWVRTPGRYAAPAPRARTPRHTDGTDNDT